MKYDGLENCNGQWSREMKGRKICGINTKEMCILQMSEILAHGNFEDEIF